MNRISQTQSGVLARNLLLLEVYQGLVKSVLQVASDVLGFVLPWTQDGVTPQLLLHLAAFVSEIINFSPQLGYQAANSLQLK